MIVTEMKPVDEILGMIEGEKGVFILCCGGCPEGYKSGGLSKGKDLAEAVGAKGVTVTGVAEIEFLCNKALAGVKLNRSREALRGADSILVVSCGVGVQAVGNVADFPVHPAMNTVSMGGRQGLWPGEERCHQCGDCLLDRTGGLCPITTCSKSLVNGTCGGTKEEHCEVDPKRPCGWLKIYQRLAALGRAECLKALNAPRDHRKYDFPDARRSTVLWALEVAAEETEEAVEASRGTDT
ncbi:MAG: methylenetetrahydrofolate reductase C-terminal domain-containing protein [Deltaproteobacteria bacterium]|nr:methylenetetrahydrofolate reductase C-terminal domain-containing protein [Deltaproteobacteria bacterium]